jgi:hypothetical protein
MRHELCLDNRNEPKWRVVIDAANRIKAGGIIYAAMFVDFEDGKGKERDPWSWPQQDRNDPVVTKVASFFKAERDKARQDHPEEKHPRGDLWRIIHLDSRIRCLNDLYSWGTQAEYVKKVLDVAKPARVDKGPIVLFLDPCNGVADTRAEPGKRNLRISTEMVKDLWDALKPDDELIVFQWAVNNGSDRARFKYPRGLLQKRFQRPLDDNLASFPRADCFSHLFAMFHLPK